MQLCIHTAYYVKDSFKVIKEEIDKIRGDLVFNEIIVDNNLLSWIYEWALALLAEVVAGDNKNLKVRSHGDIVPITLREIGDVKAIKVNIIAAAALLELTYSTRFEIFLPFQGLHEMLGSNCIAILENYAEEGAKLMKPAVLTVLVVTEDYLDKMIISTNISVIS